MAKDDDLYHIGRPSVELIDDKISARHLDYMLIRDLKYWDYWAWHRPPKAVDRKFPVDKLSGQD